jgi:hypothetical protein
MPFVASHVPVGNIEPASVVERQEVDEHGHLWTYTYKDGWLVDWRKEPDLVPIPEAQKPPFGSEEWYYENRDSWWANLWHGQLIATWDVITSDRPDMYDPLSIVKGGVAVGVAGGVAAAGGELAVAADLVESAIAAKVIEGAIETGIYGIDAAVRGEDVVEAVVDTALPHAVGIVAAVVIPGARALVSRLADKADAVEGGLRIVKGESSEIAGLVRDTHGSGSKNWRETERVLDKSVRAAEKDAIDVAIKRGEAGAESVLYYKRADKGIVAQQPFHQGAPTGSAAPKGSSIPDDFRFSDKVGFEAKFYRRLASSDPWIRQRAMDDMVHVLRDQIADRVINLPPGSSQVVVIDLTSRIKLDPVVTREIITTLRGRIVDASRGVLVPTDIAFFL